MSVRLISSRLTYCDDMPAMFLRALAAVTLLAANPLQAQTDPRPQDAAKLAEIDRHFGAALRKALAEGRRGDVDLLQDALSSPAIPALRTSLAGDWKCRTIRMGGPDALTIHAQFDCHITPDGDGFLFEKRTGSERTIGRISLRQGQMIYLGTGYDPSVLPTPYSDLPTVMIDGDRQFPQIGVVEQSGAASARILFPAPVTGSNFDLLYLTR